MKYTDRKKTPLKWHHLLVYVLMPVLVLIRIYITLGLTSELMGFHLPFVTNYLQLLLSAAGVLVTNLGSWFWPVVGFYIAEIALLVWLIYIWIQMLRWHNRGRIQWMIYLALMFLAECAAVYAIYQKLVVDEYYIILMPLLQSIGLVPPFLASHLSLFIALMAACAVLSLIIFLMNLVYYHKRKALFAAHYAQPAEELNEHENDTVVLNSGETKEPEQPVETNKTEENEEPAGQTKDSDQNTAAEPNDQTDVLNGNNGEEAADETKEAENKEEMKTDELKEKEPVSVEPEKEQPDEEMLYCPNCGAKLSSYDQNYCTHCGIRLH